MSKCCALILPLLVMLAAAADNAPAMRAEKLDSMINVYVNDKLFTAYKFSREQKYPYFYPVNGPITGQTLTTESSEPYPHHHSLFFGCDRVNGGNYWQDANARGQILSEGAEIHSVEHNRVVISDTCLWSIPGEAPVIKDNRNITITSLSESLCFIDFNITLTPLTDIEIEKTNHSLFSARVAPALSVNSGGTLRNAEDERSESGTFGKKSAWCDYSAVRDGVEEGLAVFQHPTNRWFPSPWFTRDYGFISPTPMYWPENNATRLPQGEELTLRYRVVAHGKSAEAADIAGLYKVYSAEK